MKLKRCVKNIKNGSISTKSEINETGNVNFFQKMLLDLIMLRKQHWNFSFDRVGWCITFNVLHILKFYSWDDLCV